MRMDYHIEALDAYPMDEQVGLEVRVHGPWGKIACLLDEIRMAFNDIESEDQP